MPLLPRLLAKLGPLVRDPARLLPMLRRARRILAQRGLDGLVSRLGGDEGLGLSVDYTHWIQLYDTPLPHEVAVLRARAAARAATRASAPGTTTVSVLLETDTPLSRGTLSSQLFPPHEVLAGPFALTLPKATGAFALLLDGHTQLAPWALLLAAEALDKAPATDLLFADHDELAPSGARTQPFFKPELDPELLVSLDYVSPFLVVRTALARPEADKLVPGAERYDLALRLLRGGSARRARRIPQVLAHVESPTPPPSPSPTPSPSRSDTDSSPAPQPASSPALLALRTHLAAILPGATAVPGRLPGTHHVRPRLPSPPPLVTAIVPTRDGLPVLSRFLDGLFQRTRYPALEVLVVDNGSRDPAMLTYLDALCGDPRVRVLRDGRPFNFSRLNNQAAREARGEVLALLNDDLEVTHDDWLDELVAHAVRPEIGAVGARLLYPDGRIQHAGVVAGMRGVAGHLFRGLAGDAPGPHGLLQISRASTIVTAACLVIRRELYLRMGGLDEDLAVAFNDVDFCLRLGRAGYTNLWTPFATLVHHESYSRGDDLAPGKRARFEREIEVMHARYPAPASDPLYSPNLTLATEHLEPADPPRVERPWAARSPP